MKTFYLSLVMHVFLSFSASCYAGENTGVGQKIKLEPVLEEEIFERGPKGDLRIKFPQHDDAGSPSAMIFFQISETGEIVGMVANQRHEIEIFTQGHIDLSHPAPSRFMGSTSMSGWLRDLLILYVRATETTKSTIITQESSEHLVKKTVEKTSGEDVEISRQTLKVGSSVYHSFMISGPDHYYWKTKQVMKSDTSLSISSEKYVARTSGVGYKVNRFIVIVDDGFYREVTKYALTENVRIDIAKSSEKDSDSFQSEKTVTVDGKEVFFRDIEITAESVTISLHLTLPRHYVYIDDVTFTGENHPIIVGADGAFVEISGRDLIKEMSSDTDPEERVTSYILYRTSEKRNLFEYILYKDGKSLPVCFNLEDGNIRFLIGQKPLAELIHDKASPKQTFSYALKTNLGRTNMSTDLGNSDFVNGKESRDVSKPGIGQVNSVENSSEMDKGQGRTVADIRNTGTIVLLEEQGSSNIGDGQQSLAGNDSDRGSIVDRRGSSPRR